MATGEVRQRVTRGLERVVVTGAGGRFGSALVQALSRYAGTATIPWPRDVYDLDLTDAAPLLDRDQPAIVIHAAAWTDVDGCARDPELAMRRNGHAVETLARATAARETGLVLISTAEVFDGLREDGRGYTEDAVPNPRNPYATSKLAGERAAIEAYAGAAAPLWIVRTGWLFGPPGNDFPHKILAASDRWSPEPLPVVADEVGTPTHTRDLAPAVLQLVQAVDGGLFHLASGGSASRYDWAEMVLARCRPTRTLRAIRQRDYERPSRPPPWAVLDSHKAAAKGVVMRDWRPAVEEYLDEIC